MWCSRQHLPQQERLLGSWSSFAEHRLSPGTLPRASAGRWRKRLQECVGCRLLSAHYVCVCVVCVPQKIGDRSDEDLVPLVQLAQTVPLFQQLSPPLVRMLCRSMRYLIMPRNTVICREGELGNLFYILLSGEVGC